MAKFTRKGLHKLECGQCDGFGYFTIATLEARGLPRCGWCDGETMQPTLIDLAIELGVEHRADGHLATDGYNREMSQVRALGGYQKAAARYEGIGGAVPENMHDRALEKFRDENRVASDRRRRRRVVEPAIPF